MKSMTMALVALAFLAAVNTITDAQNLSARLQNSNAKSAVQIFVPGNANGGFGIPADAQVPLVPALTIDGPGTIQVTYISGMVTDRHGVEIGPNGVEWKAWLQQFPLQEAHGVSGGKIHTRDALIGVFVARSRVEHAGFQAIDGTKNFTVAGIRPDDLVFIGESKTFQVTQAGTLFLGINDNNVNDNGGGFAVEVTGP